MKKFAKIFLAVAALVVGVACTTDATEDLGVNPVGQTTLTLSLEESRTQLGEAVEGLYPVTWSANDAISVNGVASSAIEISENQSVATFTFNEVLSYPYAIAYPATAAGKVLFADQQAYTDGTFANNAAAMYGYATAEGGLTLNHLTGVLKIGVTGDKTIVMAQVSTIDRAPIAGEFALDFATGEVTATDASKDVISCTWEESADGTTGLVLGTTPQYLHLTVPAGVYNELYVTLYDADGGVMYATVKADDEKPLVAGKVREFSNTIPYTPNASVFVIRDVKTLKEFAEAAPTLEKDALFVADVDMTGEEWTSIEGYAKTVIGNGYAIKGLTAPLFGTTNASIKGLHLEDVALNSNNAPIMGALACKVSTTDNVTPVIANCSVSGTLTVENTTFTPSGDNAQDEMAYGGLVGMMYGGNINDCTNNVAITVNQVAVTGNEKKLRPYIGGVIGTVHMFTRTDTSLLFTHLNGCVNNADILYKDSCGTTAFEIAPAVGGVVGGSYHYTAVTTSMPTTYSFTDCTNYGAVTFRAIGGGSSADTQGHAQTHVAGVVARGAYSSFYNCDNHGIVTIDGTVLQTYSGGCMGTTWYSNLENCDNYGAVTVTENTIFRGIMLAGVSAVNYDNNTDYAYYTKDCTNNAPISCLGSCDPNAPAGGAYHYRIGGCEGFGRSVATNLVNNKEGVVTCKGNVIYYTKKSYYCNIGGATAYRTTNPHSATCNYADVNVDVNFTIHADVADDTTVVPDCALFVGGIAGYATQSCANSINKGNINISGSYAGETLYVGGISGYSTLNNAENYGNITLDKNTVATNTRCFIGGLLGGNDGSTERTNLINKGNITVEGSYTTLVVGGLAGQNRLPFTNSENYGNIDIKAYASGAITAAGCIAYHVRHYYKNATDGIVMEGANGALNDCTNHGKVSVNALESKGSVYLGGVCRQGQHNMYRCVNNGELNGSGSCAGSVYVGGVVTTNSACTREDCVNNGDINISITAGNATTTGSDVFIGGMCYSGASNTTYRRCVNNGKILFSGSAANCARFGGIIANIETSGKKNIFEECVNNGDIEMAGKGSAHSNGTMRFGGLCSQFTKGTVQIIGGFKNTGDITFSGNQNSTTGISLGGIIGGNDGAAATAPAFQDCTGNIINEGKVSFTGTSKGAAYIAGIVPYFNAGTFLAAPVKLINTGDLSNTGTNKSGTNSLSGIVGSCVSPIDGAQCFCNIYAPNYPTALVGLLAKNPRTETNLYTNAKVGGSVCTGTTSTTEEDTDGNITTTVTDNVITIDATNYFNYLYGTLPDWATVSTNYDGCTVILSKDEIDYTVLSTESSEETTPEA